jgi:phosphate-selective porin OprO/OprP
MLSFNSLRRDFNSTIEDKITLYDALVGIPVWGEYGRMQIGKMKAPISMERIMGLAFEQTMERPTHLDALLDSRSIGIDFSDMIFDQRFTWKIGAFNNWLDKDDLSFSEANQEVVGRVTAVAYEDEEKGRLLHLGAAYRYVDMRERSIRYAVGPEQWFVDPWVDTGNFAAEASHTVNLEMSYLDGPLWLASEYTSTSVDAPQFGNPTFSGYHVAANYFLTGEHRGYNKRTGIVRRITPILDFTNGGEGAVEISARYSTLDLTDGAIEGGTIDISSLGLIWHPRRDMQFHMQWSRTHLNSTDIKTGIIPMKSDSDILQFRLVIVID